MKIGGLQKLTLIDYPGHLAATVFLAGCNFSCSWCYNLKLVLPEKIKKQPRISEKNFFDFLKRRRKLLEGVCISGGEPTIYKDLPKFCQKIKRLGYLVKLDTNGSNPEMLEHLIKNNLVDYIAMDVKAPINQKKYNQLAGTKVKLDKIKKSIKLIKSSKIDYQFRTTFVPQFLTKNDISEIKKYLGKAKHIVQPHIKNLESRK